MAVLWVCVLTSECSLRGACPVSPHCRAVSSARSPVAGSPAEPASPRCPVYPVCPLRTLASCLPPIPNHRCYWEQCFWSPADSKRGDKGQNPHWGRDQMEFRCRLERGPPSAGRSVSGSPQALLLEGRTLSRLRPHKNSWIRHSPKVYFIKGFVIAGDILWTVINFCLFFI